MKISLLSQLSPQKPTLQAHLYFLGPSVKQNPPFLQGFVTSQTAVTIKKSIFIMHVYTSFVYAYKYLIKPFHESFYNE